MSKKWYLPMSFVIIMQESKLIHMILWLLKKGFDSKLIYNEKYLKTKIKSYEGKVITIFRNGKMPKRKFSLYLSISDIDWLCFWNG